MKIDNKRWHNTRLSLRHSTQKNRIQITQTIEQKISEKGATKKRKHANKYKKREQTKKKVCYYINKRIVLTKTK